MATIDPKDIWSELRKPFPAGTVGKLPKPFKKDSPKGNCSECGKYHGLPAAHLDYVGHAAVTDRLNTVDPTWTWEPVALNEQGLPAYDQAGGLWIRLTVGGVTRLGYGDGPDPKERVGDALRNAAMRFGVALDLWSKDELESNTGTVETPGVSLKGETPERERFSTTPAPSGEPKDWIPEFKKRLRFGGLRGVLDEIYPHKPRCQKQMELYDRGCECGTLERHVKILLAADYDMAAKAPAQPLPSEEPKMLRPCPNPHHVNCVGTGLEHSYKPEEPLPTSPSEAGEYEVQPTDKIVLTGKEYLEALATEYERSKREGVT
ncbi:hypothetical protein [Pseudarthrobacter sp. fls2-241-R2A-168]|uniref:hypothetical protein n=1 Tax=Pseudarthrobacter sp. fls2-241-R2A-168 TaxID=3040304 RepID=UPI0025555CC7|nr:hypothetical protein [Pseudarthrobacter sp. fls2-241-R2A-168]